MGSSPWPVQKSTCASGSCSSKYTSCSTLRSAKRTEAANTTELPGSSYSRFSRTISFMSCCEYTCSGPIGPTVQPSESTACGHSRRHSGTKSCAGTLGLQRTLGPGSTSALSHTACPLECSCGQRSARSSRQGSTAASCLKSSFRCLVPSARQRSRKSLKLRSVSGTRELNGDGCAITGRGPTRSLFRRSASSCSAVPTMISASIAVMSGFASAVCNLAIEQHECTQRCCARGRGVYGGPWSAHAGAGGIGASLMVAWPLTR
mmetsp:Transcript_13725/g.35312  ORF Transcript_13725/g.35312 Transcript_13725/m.35312 type:complete len:262 (+) Transcript_13725:817-1602(+)